MKISLEWLADYLPGPLDPAQAAEALTQGGLPVESIERHGEDTILDVEVTSNRPDCLTYVGIARELSALLNRPFRDQAIPTFKKSDTAAADVTTVAIDATELCPHYTARVIRDVTVRPSPAWLARRIEAMGLRPVNNVVDVTNYVLFEMGQPLHAFDLDRLEGRRVVVRRAREGEAIVSIDGHTRALAPAMLVIADAARPVAVAGVMGGRDTEVSDATTNVLLESARFDPLSVRKTSRTLALKSDSSYRFERGIDPTLPERASLRAAQLILETAGGELLDGAVAAGSVAERRRGLSLRVARLKQVLGVEWPTEQVVDALSRLGLRPRLAEGRIEVAVPSYRLDLNREIDLVEEVARVIGYDQVPVRDTISIRLTPPDPKAAAMETIRATLAAGGYFEAVTFSFVGDALAGDFAPPADEAGVALLRADPSVRKADASLRPSVLPGLLESARRNESVGTERPRLFEIGSAFWRDAGGAARERRRLGLVGGADVREVRGVVETLLRRLDASKPIRIVPDERKGFARGTVGRIEWAGEAIGHLGKVDRATADKLSLREPPPAAELSVAPLLAGAQAVPQLRPVARFPAVRRDLSLVVPQATPYASIESLVRGAKLPLLEDLEYVTTYRGKPLEKGQKSITITLVFRSPSETLTSEQVEASVHKVVDAASKQLGATLRT